MSCKEVELVVAMNLAELWEILGRWVRWGLFVRLFAEGPGVERMSKDSQV